MLRCGLRSRSFRACSPVFQRPLTNLFPQPRFDARSFSTDNSEVNFNDTETAFKSKSLKDLILARLVFGICILQPVVRNAETLLKVSNKVLGHTVTYGIIKRTFFAHFCAGENEADIAPRVDYLRKYGVGGIMDYAAEADVEEEAEAAPDNSRHQASARSHEYKDELECDANMEIFLQCIRSVHNVSPEGFAAIKITALTKPATLIRLSNFLDELQNLFGKFAEDVPGADLPDQSQGAPPTSHRGLYGKVITKANFVKVYRETYNIADDAQLDQFFDSLDTNRNGVVNFIEFTDAISLTRMGIFDVVNCKNSGPLSAAMLTEDEIQKVRNMRQRVETIVQTAIDLRVRLMIDAEQTYFQTAIDNVVLNMQRRYNVDFPTVFHTYQCYLKNSYDRVKMDLELARRGDYYFAAKIVRGAYMHSERARAQEMGYADPIHDSLQDTHDNYHRAMEKVVSSISSQKANLMVASHNQVSMETALAKMKTYNIPPGGGVFFGQLLGMADHLTFSLGQHGHHAYKYVPYGPVHEVVPYLLRRLQENSDMMGGVGKEIKMVNSEIRRRFFGR